MTQRSLFDEIYKYGRPEGTHPHMSLSERAKIFSPFAALRGHSDAVEAMQQIRSNKMQLTKSELAPIHQCLKKIQKGDTITATYFVYDPGPDGSGSIAEGEYRTVTGEVLKIEPVLQKLRISFSNAVGWLEIRFEDISGIEISG